ncbi:hypothetical protein BCV72DRAFT_94319, partial [Rhizopus microsporus var. microsporus]
MDIKQVYMLIGSLMSSLIATGALNNLTVIYYNETRAVFIIKILNNPVVIFYDLYIF